MMPFENYQEETASQLPVITHVAAKSRKIKAATARLPTATTAEIKQAIGRRPLLTLECGVSGDANNSSRDGGDDDARA